MLLGLSSPLAHKTPQEWAARMKELGCGSVVFPVDYLAGEKVIESYCKAAKEQGLVIAEVGVWRNVLACDKDKREEAVQYAIGQLRMAEEIEAICCVNVAGNLAGPRWDGGYRENFNREAWDRTVESIQMIIDTVNPVHTKYAIESMPWMIPTGPEEYLRLIKDVDRSSFGVHLDIVNMITDPKRYFFNDEFMRKCFLLLQGRICSCHVKDVKLREEYTFQLEEISCGEGMLNLELYVQLAEEENPTMPMIIEHLHSDEEYIKSLQYVQKRLGL